MPKSLHFWLQKPVHVVLLLHLQEKAVLLLLRHLLPHPVRVFSFGRRCNFISAPASVSKMRAVQAYSGEVTFEKGATVFVVGDADSDGFFQV